MCDKDKFAGTEQCISVDLIAIKPNQAAFYLGHGHYCSHCNQGNFHSKACICAV